MRILIIANRFPSVSQTFIRLHIESLLDLGHDVTVMAAPSNSSSCEIASDNRHHAIINSVKVEYPVGSIGKRIRDLIRQLPRSPRSLKLMSLIIADYIRGRSVGTAVAAIPFAAALCELGEWDVVHVHFGNMALPVAQLCMAGYIDAPVVVTFHGTDLNQKRRVSNCEIFERVFQTASLLTVGTKHMAKHLGECNVPDERSRIIPMGIDLSRLNALDHQQRRKGNLGTRLITVGRLVECKGIEYAIRSVAKLHKSWPDVVLDIVGDGLLRGQLEQLSMELGVASALQFHGALSHERTLALLREADIYIQPGVIAADGTREGQGLAVAEAQAVGLPVVASRVGGIPEIVVEGESAFLVAPKDVSALTDKILLLIQNPVLREQMGTAGREFVNRSLNQEVLAREWTALYENLCCRPT